ncbi:MAG: aminotransferase class V-fold PLP-dependent enzyme [Myxococcota bacterium]|nr:aminotransferase class V-fold PLP-dependent enzyme [Myxococcota bacterium]
MRETREHLIRYIRESIIGTDVAIETPFGVRRVTYADYTASGRSLRFIEEYIQSVVLPYYANTHTETSGTGYQTTKLREEARQTIHQALGGQDDDCVVFCGSGATAAVQKSIDLLGIRLPGDLDERYGFEEQIPEKERPIIFVGPYEHHSNELPWRETIGDVVVIKENEEGYISLEDLEYQLNKYAERSLKIGSFSAASNVTGIASDTCAVTQLLHQHGALAFWDFAAAGPYVQIEMNPSCKIEDCCPKDAIFLSPHKFIGGPGTPGILVAKKSIFRNSIPAVPGGGTVSYVTGEGHRYKENRVDREEGGTPDIVGSIRAGLVFQLKESVGAHEICTRETSFVLRALEYWKDKPNMEILGNVDAKRLSIVSFRVRCDGRYLHHNFVVALLNDLFGIQARGGCSCAGPYAHRLLGISSDRAHDFEEAVIHGYEALKPGWVRLNFNYFLHEPEFEFLLAAVGMVVKFGWKLLPYYQLNIKRSVFRHKLSMKPFAHSLEDICYSDGRMQFGARKLTEPDTKLSVYLSQAQQLFSELSGDIFQLSETEFKDYEYLRWFVLPEEVSRVPGGVSSTSAA